MTDGTVADGAGIGRGPPEDACLAFANTRYWRGMAAPTEELRAPADLLRWCEAHAGLDAATLARVAARWQPEAALAEAIALRETIYRAFAATASGAAPAEPDLSALNAALATCPDRTHLVRTAEGWGWSLPGDRTDLGVLLAPVLWSAGDLLTGRRLARVRRCANDQCRWLFLDESKSGTRRWCFMSSCGNRAKAHRHYAKMKGGGQGG